MPTRIPSDFTHGPIARKLLLFALPILAGNIAQSLNATVNTLWISRFLGSAAMTGATNANTLLFFLIGSVFGISMASNILIAQSVGARDAEQARRVMGTSTTFFIGISVAIAFLGWIFSKRLLTAMDTPSESLALGEAYLQVTFLGIPLIYLFTYLTAALRGTGDSHTPFKFLALSVLLDIAFNPLLIFGLGPFPELGIAGSAWASLIAQAISLAALLLYLRKKQSILWLGRRHLHYLLINGPILRVLIFKGIPMGLQMMLISLAAIAMMTMVNRFGSATATAYGVAMQLWNYVQMPAMAIGAACSSFSAQNVGAGQWDRVAATARNGVIFNFLLTGLLIAVIIGLDQWTLAIFFQKDSVSFEIARHLNHIAIWSFLFFGVNFVISGVVRSTGAVIPPLLILGTSLWLIRVPFAQFLQPYLGVDAIWWSFPASAACAMIASLIYYRWGNWRQAEMLPPTSTSAPSKE